MYAVIEQGGKQYKVAEGDCINIELTDVSSDAKKVEFDKVLLIGDGEKSTIGTPLVKGAKVVASFKTTAKDAVLKGKKLHPIYFTRRKNTRRRIGHRQKFMQVTIDKIKA